MDLANLDTARRGSEGSWMELRHPATGEPLGEEGKRSRLLLLGGDSPEARLFQQQRADQRLRDSQSRVLSASDIEADDIEGLVALTRGLENIEVDGKQVSYSPEAMRLLYRRFIWLREQANRWIVNRANFLPASSSG